MSERIDPARAATYIRWSTDEQTQGTTLAVQRAACEHYIRSQGWTFDPGQVYVDDGYSGASLDRPALTALRGAVGAGLIGCVVVYALDRLSRSVPDTVELVLKEWEGRCHLRCVQQPIDTMHPAGKMFFYVLASYAEFERDMIRMRTLSGKQRRARMGGNAGWRYNYGFRRGAVPGAYECHPAEAAVVQRLFRAYLAGRGFRDLAAELNAAGIAAPAGGRWSAGSVRAILTNPIYMGRLEYGRERRLHRDGRTVYIRTQDPIHARVDGAVPAVVDPETWEAAQRRRRERAAQGPRSLGRGGYLLSGLLRCGRCHSRLAGVRSRGTRYYRCLGRRDAGAAFCDCALIPAEALEQTVAGQVCAELAPAALQAAQGMLTEHHGVEVRSAQATADLLEKELDDLGRAQHQADAAFDRTALDAQVYSRRCLELAERQAALRPRADAARRRLAELQHSPPRPGSGEVDAWGALGPAERRTLVQAAVARAAAYRPGGGRGGARPVTLELVLRV